MKYAVYVEIMNNEFMYDTGKDTINAGDKPLLFDSREEAEERAKTWNTGQVVEYHYDE